MMLPWAHMLQAPSSLSSLSFFELNSLSILIHKLIHSVRWTGAGSWSDVRKKYY